jgi:hypothetical protein
MKYDAVQFRYERHPLAEASFATLLSRCAQVWGAFLPCKPVHLAAHACRPPKTAARGATCQRTAREGRGAIARGLNWLKGDFRMDFCKKRSTRWRTRSRRHRFLPPTWPATPPPSGAAARSSTWEACLALLLAKPTASTTADRSWDSALCPYPSSPSPRPGR